MHASTTHRPSPQAGNPSGRSPAGSGFGRLLLILLFVIGLVTCLAELMLAFKAYQPIKGFGDSPWIGLAGFERLFANQAFHTMMINTVWFALLFSLFAFAMGSLLGIIVTRLPAVAGEGLALALTLPMFIPADIFANWLYRMLGTAMFVQAPIMRWLFPLLCALKMAGLPALCACAMKREGAPPAGTSIRIAALFTVVSVILGAHTFPSLAQALGTPLTYETMDLADNFLFRQQFQNMSPIPLTLLQLLFGLLATAVLYVPAKHLAGSIFHKPATFWAQAPYTPSVPAGKPGIAAGTMLQRLMSALLGLGLFTLVYFLPEWMNPVAAIAPSGTNGLGGAAGQLLATFPMWLVQVLASAAIGTLLAFFISRALVTGPGGIIRRSHVSMMLFTGLAFSLPFPFTEYLFMRSLGLVNTIWAVMLASCVSVSAIWVMAALRFDEESHGHNAATGPTLAGVFLVQSAVLWSDSLSATLYLASSHTAPMNMFRQLNTGMQVLSDAAERAAAYEWLGIAGYGIALPAMLLFSGAYLLLPRNKLAVVMAAWGKR